MKTLKVLFLVLALPFVGLAKSRKQDLTCLTQAVYFEARGESLPGKAAVANVVMNRFNKGNYKSVCAVTSQKNQFSWWPYRKARILEQQKWEESKMIANLVYSGLIIDNSRGATFFHERKIKPNWTRKLTKVGTIGSHVFYTVS